MAIQYAVHCSDERPAQVLHADVLVAGGGATGLAAAVTAARQGCKVILVERYGFCGGGAVAGLSGTICGLYEASDGDAPPRQLVHGFVDEFIAQMERRDGLSAPLKYGKTYTRVHEPLAWRESADALLAEAGVTTIYHAIVTEVLMEGDRVAGAQLYTKQGKVQVRAKVTIDATGDADLVAMTGLPTFMGDNGHVQNPTMIFRLMGVDVERFVSAYGRDTIMPAEVMAHIAHANTAGYRLPRTKIWLFPTTRPGELLCNCTRVTGSDGRELNAVLYRDFSDAEVEGRIQAREYARFFREYLAGCEASWVNDTAVQVGVRQTRQAQGVATLRNADILGGAKFADGIARSPWPIELHSGNRPRVEWLLNDFYEVPFGCFVPASGESLLFAGRCLSAEHEAVASARVTAQCFSYGHAVGHAAALSVNEHLETRRIAGQDIRLLLNRDGADLD
ncbi:Putative thiazole biosynthetic enzyme [Burkholderia lata]|uniref:FAD-dependent oxidoreductase n=1 Tax=Burkholderia lata (strain ATCC 17760 / DSM 23089 / LMG 22485 / NCIMB 9086 / R18194 / 383) TaxID=482957 RepID=UPI0014544459|nr:FAD-dependent oxidoreductase [Burkholderia lata]VWC92442.1 Putative thiazole biosynthetic enzyme [Burkholderia lata]